MIFDCSFQKYTHPKWRHSSCFAYSTNMLWHRLAMSMSPHTAMPLTIVLLFGFFLCSRISCIGCVSPMKITKNDNITRRCHVIRWTISLSNTDVTRFWLISSGMRMCVCPHVCVSNFDKRVDNNRNVWHLNLSFAIVNSFECALRHCGEHPPIDVQEWFPRNNLRNFGPFAINQ